ncbi:MAG: phosphoenolpyruvate carboxykinase (ATP) [Deltaproteobacteria bacterium]|jgi:phosphoenolpyruvate carboxykinase (ATP)|nr:phosphoenolpyruvate carboxykinase (ATP) [Deltaproteobacteria bacterium]
MSAGGDGLKNLSSWSVYMGLQELLDLRRLGIHEDVVCNLGQTMGLENLPFSQLITEAIRRGEGELSRKGTLVINTRVDDQYGEARHTGRTPPARYIIDDAPGVDFSNAKLNQPISRKNADSIYNDVINYINEKKEIFIANRNLGADLANAFPLQFITTHASRALFAINQFRDLPPEELIIKGQLEEDAVTALVVPDLKLDAEKYGLQQDGAVILDFIRRRIIVAGMKYCGEPKKGVFTFLNYIYPTKNIFPMHCGANIGENSETAVFFGLSGTGKTTLSSDPQRIMLGDDEIAWGPNGLFAMEGGCYAKLIRLSKSAEPDIYHAMGKFGALAENVVMTKGFLNYDDASITENTRGSYALKNLPNHSETGIASAPKIIFFLSADATGTLPPISRLNPKQAMYHFLMGYTSKLAGTEVGVTEPAPNFSACYGLPFMPRNLFEYAKLLEKKLQQSGARVYLVNTGWAGGGYGVGSRIAIQDSRAMIAAALNGDLEHAHHQIHEQFGFEMITECRGVSTQEILKPWQTWDNVAAYRQTANRLAKSFQEKFTTTYRDNLEATQLEKYGPRAV